MDDLVARLEHRQAGGIDSGQQAWRSTGTAKMGDAQIPVPEVLRPTRGKIHMPLATVAGERRQLLRHPRLRTQPSFRPWEKAFAKPRQQIQVERAELALARHLQHRLAKFLLAIGILDQVSLVDDVDQVIDLGHPPKDLVDPGPDLQPVVMIDPYGLTQIGMRTLLVVLVDTRKRPHCQRMPTIVPLVVEFDLAAHGKEAIVLNRIDRRREELPHFG